MARGLLAEMAGPLVKAISERVKILLADDDADRAAP